MPQTSPNWRQADNERTKGAVSVIAARNWATGTATQDWSPKSSSSWSSTSRTIGTRTSVSTTRTRPATLTTEMTLAGRAGRAGRAGQAGRTGAGAPRCRRFFLTLAPVSWLRISFVLLVLPALGFGIQAVTCSNPALGASAPDPVDLTRGGRSTEGQLTAATRSTLPDSPMTTQNDLITTASNLATAKKPATAASQAADTAQTAAETAAGTAAPTEATGSWSSTAVARGMSSADGTGEAIATSQSAQIGLTTQATVRQTEAQTAATQAAAATSAVAAASVAASVAASAAATETAAEMGISTIYPASTETDVHNSIERLAGRGGKMANAVHPGVADSLTKGFSIPTFLPPFPVFAAADLPAYRAAADAAEAAKLAAEAAAQAAAAKTSSEAVTMSPEELRRRTYNEQHSYLAAHREGGEGAGPAGRRNLTMPVLNITAQMGNHAYMPCQIHRLSDKPVSWVRMRDNHIISVDETTFIADERFQSIYQEDHDYTWSLQIKYVEPSDAGWYECQMATEPKLSAKVHLQIVKPKTELIGDQSRFVKAGSKVALHCIVRGTLDPPKYIIWFRGQKKISESDERTGWYTQLDRNIFGTVGDNQNTIGSLIIPLVRKEDSGNYTCQPSNSVSVSVDLHVLSGEYSASAIMSTAARTAKGGRSTFHATLGLLGILGLLWAMQGAMHTPPTQT
ncbi:uncharacterized protein LOC6536759 isoform X1 [Drosophila yakuba]|nr:uncharacterized protein LOC6536759 isoform X1 [Drosophila yakuba]XP_015047940.2 uncharacterized protein LOC6536759 isoform X1 [Drosophila yakuba]XP_039231491.1 uncharacterized protein LOC6536759 isoform X1 [Drosophila yakuba]XP_039231492.1 uncharacterized protein LOC6536759 isoform X1 [Drosophila yakuba]